ncbi:HAD family acid phosphatase [Henriciella sp. AS95]|uniref:HAD family acid phosphatase n=1 Tax=Henriciella sp. AS95 TaxID=3135782 RepID=UPI00317499BD
MKRMSQAAAGLFTALAIAACQSVPATTTADLSPALDWVANSPEWASEAEEMFGLAGDYVETVAAERPENSWAVVLDIDETVLNNVEYQIRLEATGEEYTPEGWHAWTAEKSAPLVPGAKQFIERVNALGGHVALVTNRADTEQLWTEENLAAVGLERHEDFRVLLTRARPEGASDKTPRFELVPAMLAAQGYPGVEVVAYIGDNKHDRPQPVSTDDKFFCINQGGMYGTPCATKPQPVMAAD